MRPQGVFFRMLSPGIKEWTAPMFRQILPSRIGLFNQRNFLFTPPTLDLLFALDHSLSLIEPFVIHEARTFVLLRESFNLATLVLHDALVEITGKPRVERSSPAGDDIHPKPGNESRLS